MNRTELKSALAKVPPPLQPDLAMHAGITGFRGAVREWNDKNVKNFAFFHEFVNSGSDKTVRLFPDNCLAILFENRPSAEKSRIVIAGNNSTITEMTLYKDASYFCFMPYSHLLLDLTVDPKELHNKHTDADDVLPKRSGLLDCREELFAAETFEDRINIVIGRAQNSIKSSYIPEIGEYCSLAMCLSGGQIRMNDVETFTGYSGRYCREEFNRRFGICMKKYNNILRFQGALRRWIGTGEVDSSDIVEEFGYYDQSHLIKEFKSFAQSTPVHLKQAYSCGQLL